MLDFWLGVGFAAPASWGFFLGLWKMALGTGGLSTSHLFRELSYLGETFVHELLFEDEVFLIYSSKHFSLKFFIFHLSTEPYLQSWLLLVIFHFPNCYYCINFQEDSTKFLSFNFLHWSVSFSFLFWASSVCWVLVAFSSDFSCFLVQTFVFQTYSCLWCLIVLTLLKLMDFCLLKSTHSSTEFSLPWMSSGYLKSTLHFDFLWLVLIGYTLLCFIFDVPFLIPYIYLPGALRKHAASVCQLTYSNSTRKSSSTFISILCWYYYTLFLIHLDFFTLIIKRLFS